MILSELRFAESLCFLSLIIIQQLCDGFLCSFVQLCLNHRKSIIDAIFKERRKTASKNRSAYDPHNFIRRDEHLYLDANLFVWLKLAEWTCFVWLKLAERTCFAWLKPVGGFD